MNRNPLRFAWLLLCLPAYGAHTAPSYHAPRLADGHVDLQGMWTNTNLTLLERPADIEGLALTAHDAARLQAQYLAPATANAPDDPGRILEHRTFEPIRGQLRSSLIIDPIDGTIPWNDAYKDRPALLRRALVNQFDNPEQRPPMERCLSSTGAPPMLPNNDNDTYQVLQTPATTVVVSEFVHDARMVRMHSTHSPPAVTSWLGDSIGWWEGDTLVIETKYFAPSSSVRMQARYIFLVSPDTTVIERFTRVSANELNYIFTVTDPTFYVRAWTGEGHFLRTGDRMFESACHEGNYSLSNELEGARQREEPVAGLPSPHQ